MSPRFSETFSQHFPITYQNKNAQKVNSAFHSVSQKFLH